MPASFGSFLAGQEKNIPVPSFMPEKYTFLVCRKYNAALPFSLLFPKIAAIIKNAKLYKFSGRDPYE
jgi:hypothetical protein